MTPLFFSSDLRGTHVNWEEDHMCSVFVNTNIHFWLVKGMNLVRELEKDLKVANVICKVRNYSKFAKARQWFHLVSPWFLNVFLCVIARTEDGI